MANMCDNYLSVEGNEKEVEKFSSIFREKGLEGFLPTPKELNDREAPFNGTEEEKQKLLERYGHSDWYNWRVDNWGTKWDVDIISEHTEDGYATFSFVTAWAPPLKALEKISEMYPYLRFELAYSEAGMGLLGKTIFEGGTVEDNYFEWEERFRPNAWHTTVECLSIEGEFCFLMDYYFDDMFEDKKEADRYRECLTKKMEEELEFSDNEETRQILEALLDGDDERIREICKEK